MRITSPSRELVGRQAEVCALEALLRDAARERGGVLALSGEPGVGKSTLLDHVRARATGFRVVEAYGSELETELPFAALHQLCRPLLDLLDDLPAVHGAVLRAAFGLAESTTVISAEPFRIGVGLLELLVCAARSGPVLCVVDDAQWLDAASVRAISFVARRIAHERVAMVVATRTGLDDVGALGVAGLAVGGLIDADARALLAQHRPTLDAAVRERLLAEARGNPLALLELPGAGGFALPDTTPAPSRVERSYVDRLAGLPEDARLLLTLAAADPTGDPALLWRAAARLGIDPSVGGLAEASGLVELAAQVRFCHPLARSAVYRAVPAERRNTAHRALAEATDDGDPDRRAWHRGQTGSGPDEDIAAELERSATRARSRGGMAAAAAFLERAAALSLDPARRTDRTLAAAQAHVDAGAIEPASALLAAPASSGTDEVVQARVELLRGRVAAVRDGGRDGPVHMLRAARRLAELDPSWSRACLLDAVETALVVGRASGVMDMVIEAARHAPPVPGGPDLLDALVLLVRDGHGRAAGPVREILAAGPPWTGRPALVGMLAVEFWDADTFAVITEYLLRTARESGSTLTLRLALGMAASAAVHAGDLSTATAAIVEEAAIADAVGAPPLPYPRLHLATLRGRPGELDAVTEAIGTTASGQTIANVLWARAVQGNAAGEYAGALTAARGAARHGDLFVAGMALLEVVEAAVRSGADSAAAEALAAVTARATAAATPWSLGTGAYARALVTGAESDYLEAVELLATGPLGPYRARAGLLHGEWLRRQGRRREAREQLRVAHQSFIDMGMEAFAARAAGELRASGEQARARSADVAEALTMQELAIARHVADGDTTKEVAARLYLSPRTVDAHLRNIFRKLSISSRRQLRDEPGLRATQAARSG